MFNKVRKLYKLKKQADPLRKEMARTKVEVEQDGIRVVMRGDQTIEGIWEHGERRKNLEKVLNKAAKKVQRKLIRKMGGRLGELF